MAIGTARMLGINLQRNFYYPYFAVDISEFWKRWHISLATWFRDYVFLPIAYSTDRKIKKATLLGIKAETWSYSIGIAITWFLVGLWHGSNWTFVFWGVLHGFYLITFNMTRKTRKKSLKFLHISSKSKGWIAFQTLFTFILVLITWAFFRSDTIDQAWSYLGHILSPTLFSFPLNVGSNMFIMLFVFTLIEWLQRGKEYPLQIDHIKWPVVRWSIYYFLIFLVFFYMGKEQSFIYFQF